MSTTQLEATLRHSKHLHIMERPGDTHIAYHKLFGNLTFLNDQALVLLKAFEQPLRMSDVTTYYAPYLEQVNYFHNLYFLSSDDTDERDALETDMQCRSDELQHGKFLTGFTLCIPELCNF